MKAKSRPGAGTPRRPKSGEKACKPSPLPFYQIEGSFTMQNVFVFLGHGAESAMQSDTLCAMLNVSPRKLRGLIMRERDAGALILYRPGGRGGYFLPSLDPEQAEKEVAAFYRVQRARCLHGLKAIAAAGRFLKIPAGQLDFNEL